MRRAPRLIPARKGTQTARRTMIYSMTGYASATRELATATGNGGTSVSVDLRTVNSRFLDLNFRMPEGSDRRARRRAFARRRAAGDDAAVERHRNGSDRRAHHAARAGADREASAEDRRAAAGSARPRGARRQRGDRHA